ncbi:MAG: GNAT family N-acetyltransferase [Ruminococcus sp.]|nr:GNAT family N-acetyltransferase [Ruminococcus sp.]
MDIKLAVISNLNTVMNITHETIMEIYPHYYPAGAVKFFLQHHNVSNITDDIKSGRVFIGYDETGNAIGTVTIKENEICRLFVLPIYQGKGYGTKLIDFAEKTIFDIYNKIILDASLPAKQIYLKKQYSATEYHIIEAENGDKLCYDVMQKKSIV